MTNKELAAAIIKTVEATNIQSATNCMTRLRLHLARRDQSMLDGLKKIDGVMGLNVDGDELQIILGPGRATNVTTEVNKILSAAPRGAIGDGRRCRW